MSNLVVEASQRRDGFRLNDRIVEFVAGECPNRIDRAPSGQDKVLDSIVDAPPGELRAAESCDLP
jgi:hypothetical protein